MGRVNRTASMLVAAVLTAGGASPAVPTGLKVVVNESVTGTAISRDLLSQIFLGKAVRWGDRSEITPVDRSATDPLRARFSDGVLNMPVVAVQHYWVRQMAAGQRPPVTKGSDAEVLELVASKRGSIGYVSEEAALPAGVRIMTVH